MTPLDEAVADLESLSTSGEIPGASAAALRLALDEMSRLRALDDVQAAQLPHVLGDMAARFHAHRARIAATIVATADTCGGEPRLDGTRLPVAAVLASLRRSAGYGLASLDYPQLTWKCFGAALDYAIDAVRARAAKPDRVVVGWRIRLRLEFIRSEPRFLYEQDGCAFNRADGQVFASLDEARARRAKLNRLWSKNARIVRVTRKVKP